MSGRDPAASIPPDFQCDYAPRGQLACPASICDCFVADYPDDPFGLHPEAFTVRGTGVSTAGDDGDDPTQWSGGWMSRVAPSVADGEQR